MSHGLLLFSSLLFPSNILPSPPVAMQAVSYVNTVPSTSANSFSAFKPLSIFRHCSRSLSLVCTRSLVGTKYCLFVHRSLPFSRGAPREPRHGAGRHGAARREAVRRGAARRGAARRGTARGGAARRPRTLFDSIGLSTDSIRLPETSPHTQPIRYLPAPTPTADEIAPLGSSTQTLHSRAQPGQRCHRRNGCRPQTPLDSKPSGSRGDRQRLHGLQGIPRTPRNTRRYCAEPTNSTDSTGPCNLNQPLVLQPPLVVQPMAAVARALPRADEVGGQPCVEE